MRRSRKVAAAIGVASLSAALVSSTLAMGGAAPDNAIWTQPQAHVKYVAASYDNATWTKVPVEESL